MIRVERRMAAINVCFWARASKGILYCIKKFVVTVVGGHSWWPFKESFRQSQTLLWWSMIIEGFQCFSDIYIYICIYIYIYNIYIYMCIYIYIYIIYIYKHMSEKHTVYIYMIFLKTSLILVKRRGMPCILWTMVTL